MLRATRALIPIRSMVWRRACGLSSPRSTEVPIPMDGRRSATTTTRGDSSANSSWTMNTSLSRAAERRADDGQSIQAASSPIWYSREPATSEPVPRRALLTPPNAGPTTRRRGMSGNVPAVTLRRRRGNVEVDVEPRLRRELETAGLDVEGGGGPTAVPDLRQEAGPEEQAVHEHWFDQPLDVLRGHVPAAVQHRPRPRRAVEGQRAADGAADRDDLQFACRPHEVDDPAPNRFVHEDLLHRGAHHRDVADVDAGLQPGQWMAAELLFHDPVLVVHVRIAERGADEEAVELRLRQREGALVLDRVLGRHDEERRGEQACDSVDGHLLLGHRLEQRGLRLRHRAIDLVHEDDVGEHRPGPELEVPLALVEDREAGHVRRL